VVEVARIQKDALAQGDARSSLGSSSSTLSGQAESDVETSSQTSDEFYVGRNPAHKQPEKSSYGDLSSYRRDSA
jgi:hypothetical protein